MESAGSRKLSMVVARLIACDVAARGLGSGALAPEHEMACDFDGRRLSVREALRLFQAQGLLTIRPGQGGSRSWPPLGRPACASTRSWVGSPGSPILVLLSGSREWA